MKHYISVYYYLEDLSRNTDTRLPAIEAIAEGQAEAMLDQNPSCWITRERPVLRGCPINELIQAIRAVNAILELTPDGPEEFNP